MFSYIHTTSSLKFDPLEKILLDENIDNYLYSLISGLQQNQFGFDTLIKVCNEQIIPFVKTLRKDQRMFIDSGGYSIIKGDVSPRNLSKFVDCYCYFLENYPKLYDYIFSLDIPIFLKYPECNNIKFIKEQNNISISRSKKILEKNKELYSKFVFVWQFKLKKQYEIWTDLYNKYFLKDKKIFNFGIGGLVGLRGITNIKFSPFIAMCYKCLDLIIKNDLERRSLIHILGIYGLHDRLIACFIDKLFNEIYLNDKNPSIEISYDTINYSVSGYMRVRQLDNILYENNIYKIKLIENFSADEIKSFIKDSAVQNQIIKDVNNLKKGKSIEKTHIFAVLNVIKQIKIDQIIKEIINDNRLFDHFIKCKNYNQFKGKALSILNGYVIKYPFIFQNRVDKNMINFQYLYAFHNWFLNDRTEKRLEYMIDKFINHINFPNHADNRFARIISYPTFKI